MLAALRKEGRQLMTDAGELFDQHGRRTAAEAQGVTCSGVAVREHLSCEERLGEPGLVSLEKRELQPLKYHLGFSTKSLSVLRQLCMTLCLFESLQPPSFSQRRARITT